MVNGGYFIYLFPPPAQFRHPSFAAPGTGHAAAALVAAQPSPARAAEVPRPCATGGDRAVVVATKGSL